MSRLRAQTGPTVSLFPFLAVLLCTMGSLLVLLVIFSRSAQTADAAAAAKASQSQVDELLLARDELAWRIEQMEGVKARTAEDLARVRMQLAGIEDNARTLADEFDSLEEAAAALEAGADEAADEDIPELERRLAKAQESLKEAEEGAADRPPAYAVVPYEGKAGTHRRPLYIECCIDGVFLQPEGIRLGPADFEGPPGPGNPLASSLRAAREYIAQHPGELGDPTVQPYPLLLVRPSGVMAYYAARDSLQSWGSDFGYQFVDEDWTLTYPPADPALAEVEARAIAEARRRLEWLAQVRPPKRTRPAVQYRASTTRGGVVSSDGPSVLGDQSQWDWTEEQAAASTRPGRGFRSGGDYEGTGDGGGDALLGQGGGTGDAGGDQWSASANGPTGSGSGGMGSGGDGPAGSDGQASSDRYRGPSKFYGGSGELAGGPAGTEAGNFSAGGMAAEGSAEGSPDGFGGSSQAGAGQAGPGGDNSSGNGSDPDAGGGADGLAGGDGAGGGTGSSAGQGTSQSAGQGGGGSLGGSLPGMPQGASAAAGAMGAAGGASGGSGSFAGQRGSNWASLASRDRPIPLTRPIRLECAAREFRILGAGGRVERRIPITGATAEAIDPLVREVHSTVESWGIAGDRMYWKPELVISATPDGGGRRDDLETLLADSGLDTRRSDTGEQVRRLPPVQRTGARFSPR